MLVGEAPGADEDAQGEPFVGPSGQLLNKMLKAARIDRSRVWTTNVCRCRPPKNRTPLPAEVQACKVWLWREFKLVDPIVIIALGGTASRLLLRAGEDFRMGPVVGKSFPQSYMRPGGIVVPIYHPSFLLQRGQDNLEAMTRAVVAAAKYADIHE
jgi:DNA polymerase